MSRIDYRFSAIQEPVRGTVLVVDDEPLNRELLVETLTACGHRVITAENGLTAFGKALEQRPDVILLDLMMPTMDGFQVCLLLKENRETRSIPILLVSAINSREDRLRAIRKGADDFLDKPVDIDDMVLRVRNAIRRKQLADDLTKRHGELQELHRIQEQLIGMVVHDLRNPIAGLRLSLELALQRWRSGKEIDPAVLERALHHLSWTSTLIDNLADVVHEDGSGLCVDRNPDDLVTTIERGIKIAELISGNGSVARRLPDRQLIGCADHHLVTRVVVNLVANAIRYSPRAEDVTVEVDVQGSGVCCRVIDGGPGVPPAMRERIFDRFVRVDEHRGTNRGGLGVGLTFCKLAVTAHDGEIGVSEAPGGGGLFWFELPACLEGSEPRLAALAST